MLQRHAERNPRFRVEGAVLIDRNALACSRFLGNQATVKTAGGIFQAAVQIFNAGSGQNVPVGVVGTCALAAAADPNAVRVDRSGSVRELLDSAIGQVKGIVWLAVEGTDGTCGVGLYGREAPRPAGLGDSTSDERFCVIQIGKVL
jgi:hypothetical protein